ncbi:primase-helicase family protein [Altererythrobacter sp. GH1-8]|uniref:primase-helicase family protein n=1 Tax=Altererythrobacter sp. GH1-8 TaxID=3349333 RepID=UPI00374C8B56
MDDDGFDATGDDEANIASLERLYNEMRDCDRTVGFESPEMRRQRQRDENVEIGEGPNVIPTAQIYTLEEMLAEFVFIKDGSQVAPLSLPQAALRLPDFRNAFAASRHSYEVEGKVKTMPVTKAWLEHRDRMEASGITFRAGGKRLTRDPNTGLNSINLWMGFDQKPAPDNWQTRSAPFVDHLAWLWGEHVDEFLDWLAHIQQKPGVLPHFGWVHISRQHGKGRNWISSVLARVWAGYVAASLELLPILTGGFNGRMSRKLLAIVDEINEGGNASYRHAQKLRQIVTEEHREINPKYGRQRVEHNICRWLFFSNHTGALPLTDQDRRFWVVSHDGEPRTREYYSELYGLLDDPEFIASVAELLKRRDISKFNPGAQPPMTDAKAELISFSQSEDDILLAEVARNWPVDLITGAEITALLPGDSGIVAGVKFSMDRAQIRKHPRKIRVFAQGPQNIYVLRNYERWSRSSNEEIKAEINRIGDGEKRKALDVD